MLSSSLPSSPTTIDITQEQILDPSLQRLHNKYTPLSSSPLASSSPVTELPLSSAVTTTLTVGKKVQYPLYITSGGGGALVFDLDVMKHLSIATGIVGQLSGTLPLAPQQNSLLGLPWRLSVYETIWLVENGWGLLVNSNEIGSNLIDLIDVNDDEILDCLVEDLNIRLDIQRESKRKQLAERYKRFGVSKEHLNSSMPNLGDSLSLPQRPKTANDIIPRKSNEKDIVFMETDDNENRISTYWDCLIKDNSNGVNQTDLINRLLEPEIKSLITIHRTKEQSLRRIRLNYEIFKYLKDVKRMSLLPGMRFGGTFVAHPGDPLRYHAKWIVESRDYYKEDIGLRRLANRGRLATGVKKKYLICGLESENDGYKPQSKSLDTSDGDRGNPVMFTIEWAGF